ncbi:MAG: alpha/beta hydrolase fold domain-containing protein [Pseudomonadales bacterium]|nr:alpha/beta hydrolase fold domain-containing protein [Pseudomonadales bacterium]
MAWLVVLLIIAVPLLTRRFLKGADLREFDRPTGEVFDTTAQDADAMAETLTSLKEMFTPANNTPGLRNRLTALRDMMDKFSDGLVFDGSIESVDANGVPAEWVVASGTDTSRRLLMIHGGAFAIGTARGYRKMSARLSRAANAAVLSIDYRLWPEFQRKHALHDIQQAYRYIVANGPEGVRPAAHILLAGDSAGGNLVLALTAWLRDQQGHATSLPQAGAVLAICPTLDSTLSGPSVIYNAQSDVLLGGVGQLMRRVPHGLVVLAATILYRMSLAKPEYSPVFGRLHQLPPILIHASDSEILFSDAIRYTNKARRDGSAVRLQIWRGMQHDWHVFADNLLATEQAWQELADFVQQHCPALERAG